MKLACEAFFRLGEAGAAEGTPEPLTLAPRHGVPPTWAAIAQTTAALAVIFAASRFFVIQLDVLGPQLGIRPQLVALLFSPSCLVEDKTDEAHVLRICCRSRLGSGLVVRRQHAARQATPA